MISLRQTFLILAALAALALLLASPLASPLPSMAQPVRTFDFVVLGDMPYHRGDIIRMERLIDTINQAKPAFVIHVGDIKGGGVHCTDEKLATEINRINRIAMPVFYTPGDNEWLDCRRPSNGRYDSFERLAFLRGLAFAKPQTLGGVARVYERQSAAFPENGAWQHNGVHFVKLHVVGSNNARGLGGKLARAHFDARAKANQAWLERAFAQAKRDEARGLVVVIHANPFIHIPFISGHAGFLAALRKQTRAFRQPVLLIHGDSHEFRVDQPWRNSGDRTFDHFTRLETFGDEDIQAVRVSTNPDSTEMFRFAPLYAPGERETVDDKR